MNIMQLVQLGAFWGTIFGLVFSIAMLIIGRVNAEMILNDYPPDVRTRFGPMSARTRKQANLASIPLVAALGLIIVLGLGQLRNISGELTFIDTFIYGFHFRKFLNGIVFTLILSVIVTAIALGVELIL